MEVTEQDVVLVHDMVRDMATEQFETFGEAPPFFAAVGSKEPEKLEELTKVGGLPLKMERLTQGSGPILIGFYLASVPKQLWSGIMSAVAADIDATALIFTTETWIVEFPNENGEGEAKVAEWYANHADLSEFPKRKEAIILNVHHKGRDSTLEVAMIDEQSRELRDFAMQKGREKGGDIKW